MSAVPTWVGPTTTLVEMPGSPSIDYSEELVRTRTYKGLFSLCESSAPARWSLGTGAEAGYMVAKATVSRERGNIGTLTVVYKVNAASSGQPLPPDDYDTDPFEINPRVERNSAFSTVTDSEMSHVQAAVAAGDAATRAEHVQWVTSNGSTAAKALLALMLRGTENYYQAGMKYIWSQSLYTAPAATLGGFIEVPGGTPGFTLPAGMSWLRMADKLGQSGGIYRITRTWMGGPAGLWSTVLYP